MRQSYGSPIRRVWNFNAHTLHDAPCIEFLPTSMPTLTPPWHHPWPFLGGRPQSLFFVVRCGKSHPRLWTTGHHEAGKRSPREGTSAGVVSGGWVFLLASEIGIIAVNRRHQRDRSVPGTSAQSFDTLCHVALLFFLTL